LKYLRKSAGAQWIGIGDAMSRNNTCRSPLFHGWYVVAVCIIISIVTTSARGGISVFVIPMSEDFGWSRGTISIAASLGFLLTGLTQPFLGGLLDRIGGRRVILVSLVILGLSIAALGLTFHILFVIFIFGGIAGTAFSGTSPSNTSALIAKWFRRRRATAIGLNAAGVGLGGLVIIPLASYMIQDTNWRVTWLTLGLMILLVAVPLVYLLVHDDPDKLGLRPDGDPQPSEEVVSQTSTLRVGPLEAARWTSSFRSWPIWQMSVAYFVDGFTTANLLVHFVPYAIDRGASPSAAAIVFGFTMALSIIGSTIVGLISDRIERKTVLTLIYSLRGCAYIVVLLLPGSFGLWVFAAVFGLSFMATAPLTTSLTADIYGLRALGAITGVSYLFRQIGGTFGILITGYLFDITGSYALPFAIAGFLLLPAALVAFSVNERKYSARYQDKRVVAPLEAPRSEI